MTISVIGTSLIAIGLGHPGPPYRNGLLEKADSKSEIYQRPSVCTPYICCVMPYYWTRTSLFLDIFGWYLVGIWRYHFFYHPSELRSRVRHLERQGFQGHVHKAGSLIGPREASSWINYNELTTSSLEIIVSKGNHPQMAARFRLVNYYNLPRSSVARVFQFVGGLYCMTLLSNEHQYWTKISFGKLNIPELIPGKTRKLVSLDVEWFHYPMSFGEVFRTQTKRGPRVLTLSHFKTIKISFQWVSGWWWLEPWNGFQDFPETVGFVWKCWVNLPNEIAI